MMISLFFKQTFHYLSRKSAAYDPATQLCLWDTNQEHRYIELGVDHLIFEGVRGKVEGGGVIWCRHEFVFNLLCSP